ncbi:hypothetical protein MC77_003855 [Citrobacter koseri]|nr:hypothetical protein MC77_003855 [Citrobacter koseri]
MALKKIWGLIAVKKSDGALPDDGYALSGLQTATTVSNRRPDKRSAIRRICRIAAIPYPAYRRQKKSGGGFPPPLRHKLYSGAIICL